MTAVPISISMSWGYNTLPMHELPRECLNKRVEAKHLQQDLPGLHQGYYYHHLEPSKRSSLQWVALTANRALR
jgi:hypothetical protein